MNTDFAVAEKAVGDAEAIATAMQASAPGIRYRFVTLDTQREIGFDKFVGYIGKSGPQGVSVRAVADRAPGNTAKANLKQLEPFALLVVAGIEQVG